MTHVINLLSAEKTEAELTVNHRRVTELTEALKNAPFLSTGEQVDAAYAALEADLKHGEQRHNQVGYSHSARIAVSSCNRR